MRDKLSKPSPTQPLKKKNPVTCYPLTSNSFWYKNKPLVTMLEQEEHGNVNSLWEPILAFLFPLVMSFTHAQVNQASSRDHALQGKCVQVQCNLQVLSSRILRTQTDGTVSEMAEVSSSFYLPALHFCSLPSGVKYQDVPGKDVPSTSNRTSTLMKEKQWKFSAALFKMHH